MKAKSNYHPGGPAAVEQQRSPKAAYTIAEVCEQVGLGRTMVYSAIKGGGLIARKCGRRTIVCAEDLKFWLSNLPATSDSGGGHD